MIVNLRYLSCLLSALLFMVLLLSCGTARVNQNPVYFRNGADTVMTHPKETVIQPNDLLNIQFYSKTTNQEQAMVFNQANVANGAVTGYQVSQAGQIDIPIVGAVKAAGLTRRELQELLEQKLTPYVKNPFVLIRFLQFKINILGEVKSPNMHQFVGDNVTLIDAISAAGDLTDYGNRENVTVIRETEGKKIYHTVNLGDKQLFSSPVYYLQPNDIVYISPTKNKLKNLATDPDTQRRTSLFLSVLTAVVGVAGLVITSLK